MDIGTAKDMIEDLRIQLVDAYKQLHELRERIRQLEAERDQWQNKAVSNG